jgi:hypothetical protein
MNILEIGGGFKPIRWSGEAANYVGIDPAYRLKSGKDRVSRILVGSEQISAFRVYGCRVEQIERGGPPDRLFMANVLGAIHDANSRHRLVRQAVRLGQGQAEVTIIESYSPYKAKIKDIAEHLGSLGVWTQVLDRADHDFGRIWEQTQGEERPKLGAKMLIVPPQEISIA